ncbi:MAG: hypothetical protein ACREFB_04235 [Stellaceae bacterium]
MSRNLIPLCLAALVGACAPSGAGSTAAPGGLGQVQTTQVQTTLQKFTVADLQAADADAKAHHDALAATCYEALMPVVQAQPNLIPGTAPKGLFTAFQQGRDGVNAIQAVPSALKGLNVACGPLVLDAQQTVLALGLKIAPAALPALPPLPALP